MRDQGNHDLDRLSLSIDQTCIVIVVENAIERHLDEGVHQQKENEKHTLDVPDK